MRKFIIAALAALALAFTMTTPAYAAPYGDGKTNTTCQWDRTKPNAGKYKTDYSVKFSGFPADGRTGATYWKSNAGSTYPGYPTSTAGMTFKGSGHATNIEYALGTIYRAGTTTGTIYFQTYTIWTKNGVVVQNSPGVGSVTYRGDCVILN